MSPVSKHGAVAGRHTAAVQLCTGGSAPPAARYRRQAAELCDHLLQCSPVLTCLLGSLFIADTGKVGGKLLGIVTTRDWDFVSDMHTPLSEIMTSDIETAQYGELRHAAG